MNEVGGEGGEGGVGPVHQHHLAQQKRESKRNKRQIFYLRPISRGGSLMWPIVLRKTTSSLQIHNYPQIPRSSFHSLHTHMAR
jgi:hypothetical protein